MKGYHKSGTDTVVLRKRGGQHHWLRKVHDVTEPDSHILGFSHCTIPFLTGLRSNGNATV